MTDNVRSTITRWTEAVLLALVVAYPLSYAPFVRWRDDGERVETVGENLFLFRPIHGDELPLYKPIDWLIDNTPLQTPLLAWARLWSIDYHFKAARLVRRRVRSDR